MRFLWDDAKSCRNLAKHKVSFETAMLVFDDPNAVCLLDRVVDGEERWHTLGLVGGMAVLLVSHTCANPQTKRLFALSRRAKLRRMRGRFMSKVTNKQMKEIRALKNMKDRDIDLSDIPEVKEWSGAVVGKFYRPVKKQLTIRLDADVVAWLQSKGRGYQTRINGILRSMMQKEISSR